MRIGVDVSQTGPGRAGCGNVAYYLTREIAEMDTGDDFILYPTFGNQFWDDRWGETFFPPQVNFSRALCLNSHTESRYFWETPPADLRYRLGRPDIIHSHNFFCPPPVDGARLVYTLYDLSFLENPDWSTEANREGCFRNVFRASIEADHILAISGFSREHFLSLFPHFPKDRISVMPLASRFPDDTPLARPPEYAHLGEFLLTVGTLEPRKNYRRLVEAYSRVHRQFGGKIPPLVIAGNMGWLMEDFQAFLASLGIAEHVIFLGFVSDVQLQWLYQNAYGVLYPSLWEGFGLPVLEALSQGAAVISSDVSSIPEILGDAGLMVDPVDTDSIAGGLADFLRSEDLRAAMRAKAKPQAERFSWRTSAQTALDCYREVAARPPRRQPNG
ncbi:glycosyltransferase family 4 protein [Paramagnetospirillum magneticum]|uniref:Glycosyltransferase n=1 Tax=Paramagnetospirillum magneticum (strain ATCC 700264 / AMB-1) TaxID=342108 RepID=Q2W8E2_PARM1|nr:glycosyltransferase family 1 protein [Paramagnetospirillum magneticum]BAE49883.1 Glycosyltransferase [Paramagnetospirillum magneticum AMB-1]